MFSFTKIEKTPKERPDWVSIPNYFPIFTIHFWLSIQPNPGRPGEADRSHSEAAQGPPPPIEERKQYIPNDQQMELSILDIRTGRQKGIPSQRAGDQPDIGTTSDSERD
jgi:hypothetical protein